MIFPSGLEVGRGEPLAHAVGQSHRVVGRAGREDHGELLAADPADDIGRPHQVGQDLGEPAQQLVTGAVAVDVVHLLEVVEVEEEQRHGIVRPVGPCELGSQPLVERAVICQARQPVGLRLPRESGIDLRVVERQRGRVAEAYGKPELLLGEADVDTEAIDVEGALDRVAGDEWDRDQGFGLVVRSSGNGQRSRVEMNLIREDSLTPLHGPAGDPLPERAGVVHHLLGPAVPGDHRVQEPAMLVRLVDRQGVVRNDLRQRIGDPLQQRVE